MANCDHCGSTLRVPPGVPGPVRITRDYHLCNECYQKRLRQQGYQEHVKERLGPKGAPNA